MNPLAAFQSKYQNNVEMVLQQMGNPLLDAVTISDDASAEKIKIKDLVGNNAAIEADERHGDTKYNSTTFDGVWIAKPNELYDADLVDNADKLGTAIALDSAVTASQAGTIQRARIQRTLEGFYGPIISGKDGTTTTTFPAGQQIAATVGGASGNQKMNTAKLRAANKLLLQNYVNPQQEKFMILTADDNDALLTEVPATSADFKAAYGGVVEDGILKKLLGWTFIPLELDNPLLGTVPTLATESGTSLRLTPFWVKPGLVVNRWQNLRTMVDPVPTKLGSIQLFNGTTLAASRTQPGMSGIIKSVKG